MQRILPTKREAAELSGRTLRWWCVAVLTASLLACHGRQANAPAAADFDIVLAVLDACRPDKIGAYGFERETSPAIDALARDPDAVLFRRHYVAGSWTKPSTASLFTGFFPHQHGVLMGHRDGRATGGANEKFHTQILDERFATMAERLRDAGFATIGVVKSLHLVPGFGFAQGFDRYHSPLDTPGGDPGKVKKFLEEIGKTPGRFFGYLHVNACHNPFGPQLRDPDYMARYPMAYDERSRVEAGVDFGSEDLRKHILDGKLSLTEEDVRFLHLIYEAKLRQTDRESVAPLLDGLRTLGRYDRSLVLLTADHGEELYDHRGYSHGHALWDEVIHVPLIVKFPKGTRPNALGHEVTRITSSVDLLPSLLALTGVPASDALPGRPILQGVFGDFALAENSGADQSHIEEEALVQGEFKLIDGAGGTRLFRLRGDPQERTSLAALETETVAAMRSRLQELRAGTGAAASAPVVDTELTPEQIETLKSLGYL
jgi:arylsulfatase A-like enzyme